MVEATLRVKSEPIGAGGRNGRVPNVQCFRGPLRRLRVGDPDPPRPAVRTVPKHPALAHVNKAMFDALGAEDPDDAVRSVTLSDAVKREAQPPASQDNPIDVER